MNIFGRKKKKAERLERRSYSGAAIGRLFSDFITPQRTADSELRFSLKTLRERCRDLSRNNEYAKRYLQLLTTNVVGERGVNIQSRGRNADRSLDAPGNKIIENSIARWGRLGNCTTCGNMSWVDCQRFVIQSLARDGEVLVRKVRNYNNEHGFALQFLEADYLDEEKNERLSNGRSIRMGVEVDQYGKPIAYHLLTQHPGDYEFMSNSRSRQHIRVPADEILHIFIKTRTNQTRGEPFMASALSALKMLQGYREAELVAARVGAAKMGFIVTQSGDEYLGDGDEGGAPLMNSEPGTFEQLAPGQSIQMFDPQHPTSAFASFEKAVLRGIASGLGVSYSALSNDLESVNYSSIRQGALEERDYYKTLQNFLVSHFIDPIMQEWLAMAMTNDAIPLPISKFDKFAYSFVYRPRGFQWVDPKKEMEASIIGLQNGLLSMQDVANHYGRDVQDVFEQVQREKEMAESMGIKFAFEPFGAQKAPVEPEVSSDE